MMALNLAANSLLGLKLVAEFWHLDAVTYGEM